MVGDQAVYFAVEQLLPHSLLVLRVADRRRALRQGANRFELLGIQHKVVRTGFAGDVLTLLTRAGHFGDPFRAADVAYVQAATGDFRQIENAADRLDFGEDRTRRDIIMCRHAALSFCFFAELIADQRIFTVHQHGLLHFGQLLRAFEKLPVVNVAEVVVDPAIAAGGDKAFEAHHAHFIQLMQAVQIIGNQAAKLRGVDG